MRYLVFLLLIVFPFMAFSQQNCLPQNQADFLFNNFRINQWSAATSSYNPVNSIANLCDSQAPLVRVARALHFMEGLNGSQNPKSISVVSQEGAGNFFKKRIAVIDIETTLGVHGCVSGTVAYVSPNEHNEMHICAPNLSLYDSDLMTSYVLIHEARHTEGYSHVHCTHGAYGAYDRITPGAGSCDDSFENQGSYGVGAGFMADIYSSTQDPVLKQEARSNLVTDFIERFNKLPLNIHQGLAAHSETGEVSFFDGSTKNTLFMANPRAFLVYRLDIPVVFDAAANTVKSYYYSTQLQDTPGPYAMRFTQKFSAAERDSLKDVYSGNLHNFRCLLFDTKVVCRSSNSDTEPELEIPLTIKPVQFLLTENSVLVDSGLLMIVAEDGSLAELPSSWSDLKLSVLLKDDLARFNKNYGLKSLVTIGDGLEYGVDFNGNLSSFDPNSKSWSAVKPYSGQKIKRVVAPFFWSKVLENL